MQAPAHRFILYYVDSIEVQPPYIFMEEMELDFRMAMKMYLM